MAGTKVREKSVAFVPVLALNALPTRTAVSSKFGGYSPEKEHIVRKAEVKPDLSLENLKQLYRKTALSNETIPSAYDRLADSLKNHDYSAKDIERFSIALAEFQEEVGFSIKAGLFVSALINTGKEQDYVIQTRHLALSCLGCKNTKNLTVKGNAGNSLGSFMKGGQIHIEGAFRNLDEIKKGKIYHKGELIVDK